MYVRARERFAEPFLDTFHALQASKHWWLKRLHTYVSTVVSSLGFYIRTYQLLSCRFTSTTTTTFQGAYSDYKDQPVRAVAPLRLGLSFSRYGWSEVTPYAPLPLIDARNVGEEAGSAVGFLDGGLSLEVVGFSREKSARK